MHRLQSGLPRSPSPASSPPAWSTRALATDDPHDRPGDRRRKHVAVVGAGPAGLAAATTAAGRGHHVTLFEADDRIGGQFNLAKQIPGKGVPRDAALFRARLEETGVDVKLGTRVTAGDLTAYDVVLVATGVTRASPTSGRRPPKVVTYLQVLRDHVPVGERVAIAGAGGIGFDVAEFLTRPGRAEPWHPGVQRQWGSTPRMPRPAASVAQPLSGRRGRLPFCSARTKGRCGTGKDDRLDPPHPAQASWRGDGAGRGL